MHEKSLINSILSLLRICSVFLAAVSFWSTAKGMEAFVFDTGWQAYGASFAVQGILLGLSLISPKLWKQAKGITIKIILVILSLVVLFCSSWFSYVYIAGNIYEDSWDTESMILIQNKYREHLYKENDYVEKYQKVLEAYINEQLSSLYEKAKNLKTENSMEVPPLVSNEEREKYSQGGAADSEMNNVFNAYENAVKSEATTQDIEHAQEIVNEMRIALNQKKTTTDIQLSDISSNILETENNLKRAINDLEDAGTYGTDTDTIEMRINNLSSTLLQYQNQQNDYRKQLQEVKDAISRIDYYEGLIKISAQSSFNNIISSLLDIQKQLIQKEPNIEDMILKTTNLYEEIQNNSNETEKSSIELLTEINTFIQQLTDYQDIKQLQTNMNDLQNIETVKSKSAWNAYLEKLKNSIAKVPVSLIDAKNNDLEYNKTKATEELNELIRLYISKHNVAQQGIIYLFNSPHPALALFALILALFLDIASFIVGVAIEIHNSKSTVSTEAEAKETQKNETTETEEELYSTVPCAQEYLIFTGDYEKIENNYIYKVIENGKLSHYTTTQYVKEPNIYVKSGDEIESIQGQELCFDLGKEQDGIYKACSFSYFEERLSIKKPNEKDYKFLANISEDVFVYKMTRDNLEIEPVSCLFNTYAEKIVLALNRNKTKIASIFMIDLR